MYFDLSKSQALLGQSVRDFCKRAFPPERVRELMETDSATDGQLWSEIADQGWIGLHLDEQYDGLGLGLVELAVVAEELGRVCAPGPWLSANWAASLLAAVGGSVASQYLPKIVDGSVQATVAVLEDQGSWDIGAGEMRTRISDDGSTLSGCKQLVIQAQQADLILCAATRAGEPCLVLVPTHTDGATISVLPGIDLTRKVYQCEFNNVQIKPEQIVASGENARRAWEQSQQVALVAVTAEMLGLMQWMFETTVEHAKSRQQFDRPIGAYQAIQAKCADILMLTESARSAVWYAAWAVQEQRDDAAKAVAVAKVFVSDAAREVGNRSIQSHGGIGFTWEHQLHLYYKRAKADEFLFGDPTHHREILAEIVV